MSRVFDAYARYYDLLYANKDYAGEARYVASGLDGSHRRARILELGCGTGGHAEHLARMGHAVHGVDMSGDMIDGAEMRKTSVEQAVRDRLSFGLGDVRTVRTGEIYDAVVSLFHVMSYQVTNADLDAAFRTAASHLSPGGIFLFDFWYGPAVLTQRPETRIKRMEDAHSKVVRMAESTLHENDDCVDVKFTVLVDDVATGSREQIVETHRMRYLFLPELELLLTGAGFDRIQSREWLTENSPSVSSWSVMTSARKVG